jgi:type I restriction enzyme S subunit
MNSWKKLPTGEIFSIQKGSLQSTKCTPGDFTFITASSEWKTHNEYSHDCEALIYAVAASGSLGRCHYFNGKFISSDLCFILRAKDEKKRPINYRFYQNVFRFLKDDIVAKTKAGTSKESISKKRFSAYTLPYIDIEHQAYWEMKLNNFNEYIESFHQESENQSTYLTKLRQAILQEAIEGKLTAGWRKANPVRKGDPDYDAKALLEKIKAEKEKLIKEGKIKKQKPLAPIKPEEVPFELPEGWVWTRLGEISDIKGGKRVANGYKLLKEPTPHIYIRVSDMKNGTIDDSDIHYIDEQMFQKIKQYTISKNDLYMTIVGATIGKCGLVPEKFDNMNLTENAAKIIIHKVNKNHLLQLLSSPFCQNQFIDKTKQVGVQKMALNRFSTTTIPLPPLAEQQAIVERVEKLLSMVNELEKQVSEQKEQSEQLMQAVLREAFEGGKTLAKDAENAKEKTNA